MNIFMKMYLKMFQFEKIGKMTYCTMYSNGVGRSGAYDTDAYLFDKNGKKILHVFNGSFDKRIDERYFVILGNSEPDSFFTKEFFIIDEMEGKVIYKGNRGDNFSFAVRAGNYHYYVAFKARRGSRTSIQNMLQPNEPLRDGIYINTIHFNGVAVLERDDGSFDYIGMHESGEIGIQNCKNIRVVHEGYFYEKALGIIESCDKNNNLYYLVSEEGVELNQPFKHLDGIFNNETKKFFLVGILPNGEIVSVGSRYGYTKPLEVTDLTDYDDGVKFRKVGEIIQLVDKDGNVVLGSITKLIDGFKEREVTKDISANCAVIIRDNMEYFVNHEGKIFYKYRDKWM